jgi:hypothetical protein
VESIEEAIRQRESNGVLAFGFFASEGSVG